MKVKFKVSAEWEEEVTNETLTEIAEETGMEGDEPTEAELNEAFQAWINNRTDEIELDPTNEIPEQVTLNVSNEPIS